MVCCPTSGLAHHRRAENSPDVSLPLPFIPGLRDHLLLTTLRPQSKQPPSPHLGKLFHELSLQLSPQAVSFCPVIREGSFYYFLSPLIPLRSSLGRYPHSNGQLSMASRELWYFSYCRGGETQPSSVSPPPFENTVWKWSQHLEEHKYIPGKE